jgi:hypothetical protein
MILALLGAVSILYPHLLKIHLNEYSLVLHIPKRQAAEEVDLG